MNNSALPGNVHPARYLFCKHGH